MKIPRFTYLFHSGNYNIRTEHLLPEEKGKVCDMFKSMGFNFYDETFETRYEKNCQFMCLLFEIRNSNLYISSCTDDYEFATEMLLSEVLEILTERYTLSGEKYEH